jgi:D-arabinose 1-dehydrogenase-like Zn-dependent alcohol dehydrogenase
MGTKGELESLLKFLVDKNVRPVIDSTMPLSEAHKGLEKMHGGDVFGKIVLTI